MFTTSGNIEIYDKVGRILINKNLTLRDIFGKEKTRIIKKGLEEAMKNEFQYGISKLTLNELQVFEKELYLDFIKTKENPNPSNLTEKLSKRIESGEEILFGYIKQKKKLLAGGIFTQKKFPFGEKAILGRRAYKENNRIHGLKLGYYIEYLFYEWALDKKIKYISRGKDRNGYGYIGGNIGLPLHKLELHHIPRVLQESKKITINTYEIPAETLIFYEESPEKHFTKAIIRTEKNEEEVEKKYGIIKKRGIELKIIKNKFTSLKKDEKISIIGQ